MRKIVALAVVLTLSFGALAQNQVVRAFSYRGGRMENDENILPAFEASCDAGCNGFETDIPLEKKTTMSTKSLWINVIY